MLLVQALAINNYIQRDIECVKNKKDPLNCNQMKNAPMWEKLVDISYYNTSCIFAKGSSMENVYCREKND